MPPKPCSETIAATVAESHDEGVEERNHLAAGSPAQMAVDVDWVVAVARCLATLRLVFEMVRVSKVLRRYQKMLQQQVGLWLAWSWKALQWSLQQLLRSSRCGDFDVESE